MSNYDLVGEEDKSPAGLLIAAGRKLGVKSIVESKPHPLMMALANKHALEQADVRRQSHNGFDMRAADVMRQFPGAEVSEICAESWPNQTDVESADDAYVSWRQSPGHWKACNSPHTWFGYGMARGKNGIWYDCGIFANCANDNPGPDDPRPPKPRPCGWLRHLLGRC
jgi:hypothetical protein